MWREARRLFDGIGALRPPFEMRVVSLCGLALTFAIAPACSSSVTIGSDVDGGDLDGGGRDAAIVDGALDGGIACSTRTVPCPDDMYCAYAPGNECGGSDTDGLCTLVPTGCPDNADPVCGCDAITYINMCEARAAHTDIAYRGPCTPSCRPREVAGSGPCDSVIGFYWDGAACVSLSGCDCVGADCGMLFDRLEVCMTAYAACGADAGT